VGLPSPGLTEDLIGRMRRSKVFPLWYPALKCRHRLRFAMPGPTVRLATCSIGKAYPPLRFARISGPESLGIDTSGTRILGENPGSGDVRS
jgi:hypothetical protein